jgi:hypothetical protein
LIFPTSAVCGVNDCNHRDYDENDDYDNNNNNGNWGSLVGIATGYGLDDRRFGARVPVRSRISSSLRCRNRHWGPLSLISNAAGG